MKTDPTYLGDGVYANFDGMHIVIGTRAPDKNLVFLDQTVWQALVDYGDRVFGSPVEETLYGNCSVCGEPISDDEEPHSDEGGEDCHERCCPVCHKEEQTYEYIDKLPEPPMQPKYPHITVKLTGTGGNTWAVLGAVNKALHENGLSKAETDAFFDEATSGSYDHLLQTVTQWVEVR